MSFSLRVTSQAWRDDAEAWVHEQVARRGATVTGSLETRRVRPWGAQAVVDTDRGPVWLKASGPRLTFEPALHALVARLLPDVVDAPLAWDADRGWLLTADRGPTLGERRTPTQDDWRACVRLVARAQRTLVDHRAEVLATGLPDCSPTSVPIRLDRLVTVLAGLPEGHPSHVDPTTAARLRAARQQVVDVADELAQGPLPATLQHGDVHPRNVLLVGEPGAESPRLMDFGDAQWAHPAESLVVARRWATEHDASVWPAVQEAYGSVWVDVASPRALERLRRLARVTHAVNHTLTWWMCLDAATPQEWEQWGAFPRDRLAGLLEVLDES